jgi:hypothetical protein
LFVQPCPVCFNVVYPLGILQSEHSEAATAGVEEKKNERNAAAPRSDAGPANRRVNWYNMISSVQIYIAIWLELLHLARNDQINQGFILCSAIAGRQRRGALHLYNITIAAGNAA